eukprot:TRINITY_DN2346_c0_g1_i2.p2 TRINITY_DN2346_c0_g1~~TRINITY_DN2346_c0_g1_i2.p2  ORF type:complete len:108 (+),score=39.76 TRINITY_DN2346_c0_g1_i2:1155-1478(+)
MHERKAKMAKEADCFVALPGGFGTYEELFEVITWLQLGIHHKPIGVLNVDGYFDPFVSLVENGISAGFIGDAMRDLVVVDSDPERLLEALKTHEIPATYQWLREKDA